MKKSLLVIVLAAWALAGCKRNSGAGNSSGGGGSAAAQVFRQRCAMCHGDSGHGDGPSARALRPKPRSFADARWQRSISDAKLRKVIVSGGGAIGKSAMMPAHADLAGKPVLDALIKHIRALGKK